MGYNKKRPVDRLARCFQCGAVHPVECGAFDTQPFMSEEPAGYREIEHTADWELEVWAPDMCGLLEQAARGMYQLSGIRLSGTSPMERYLKIKAQDDESLLVGFLQELLYIAEIDRLGFNTFDIHIDRHTLNAKLAGSQLDSVKKEIKAVTYHELEVVRTDRGVRSRIVFDV